MIIFDRAGTELGMNPQLVAQHWDRWIADPHGSIIRQLLALKLADAREEKTKAFRAASSMEDVKKLQGALDALDLAETILTQKTP